MRDNVHEPMIDKLTHEIKCYFDTLSKTYYHQGLEDGIEEGAKSVKSWDKACYEQGLNDAWEAAGKIIDPNIDFNLEYGKLFECATGAYTVLVAYTASEAIAKIKEYEEKQTDDKIQVGDEVILIKPNTKSIVWKISGDLYYLIGKNVAFYSDELKATGRHFDEIEEILKQKVRDKE